MNKKIDINKIRPVKEHIKYYKLLEGCGYSFYEEFNNAFVKVNCPGCGSEEMKEIFIKYNFIHCKCEECNTLFCNPRPKEESLIKYYQNYESALYLKEILLKTDVERKSLQDSNFFKKVIALDFNKECVDICLKNGIEARIGSIDKIDDDSVGLLTMNDLIEHVHYPFIFLIKCHSKLVKNGFIFINTPNGEGFDFQILKEKTVNITPPEHLNYFNPYSIGLLAKRAGFKIVKVGTPGILDVQIVMREIENGKINLKKENNFLQYLLYDTSEETVSNFQKFLTDNLLSSHMFIIARKI